MNARERFLRIMRFEPVNRLPVMALEPFEKTAIERWRKEGLPPDTSPVDFLGMDQLVYVGGVGLGPVPAFEARLLHEDAEYLVETTSMGATVRRRKDAPSTFYGYIDHPIKTRADWDRYKERMDPASPERARADLTPERIQWLNSNDNPVGLCFFPFFFRFGFYTMGMERFLTAFHQEPDMMRDMFSHCADLLAHALRNILGRARLDFALIAEDLACKHGPLVSPRMYDEFWRPHQEPLLRTLRQSGVPVICQWSAGEFGVLLPDMLDQGFNATWPLEAIAGMDPYDLRRRYGSKLLLGGNLPKEALIAGPAAIDREVERLLPLIRQGGFLPALDDMPPMECPFAHYRHMIDRLQTLRIE